MKHSVSIKPTTMLAKSPLDVPESIKFNSKITQKSSFLPIFHSKSPKISSFLLQRFNFNGGSKTQWSSKTRVSIKAGYTRKPMETAGAYQLIDEETGEKCIVWGGVDDDETSTPTKEAISWKPKSRESSRRSQSSSRGAGTNSGDTATSQKSSTGSFGKLKVQKVRALSRKFTRSKEDNVGSNSENSGIEDTNFGGSDFSDSEPENVVRKMHSGIVKHKRHLPGASQLPYVRDRVGGREKTPSFNHSNTNQEYGSKRESLGSYEDENVMDRVGGREKTASFNRSNTNQDYGSKRESLGSYEDENVTDRVGGNEKTTSFNRSNTNQDYAYDEFDTNRRATSFTRAASSAPLGGWHRAVQTEESTYDSRYNTRQRGKFSYDNGFFSKKNFKDLGYSEDVIGSLRSQHYVRPSHIQAMAFPSVIEEKSCIIADQSGSGKTLAYLAPVIQRLRQEELQGLSKSSSGSPRVVILVPTAELASQVLSNCRSMSKFGIPFRSMVATGGFRQKTQLETLQQDLDVLIATPGRFIYLLKEGFLKLTNLRCAVLDEVDILYGDEDFEQVLQSLINSAPVTIQYLFVTATLPVEIYNKLVEVFPDCEVIMGPGMHRTSSGLEEVLVDCSGEYEAEKTPETAFLNKKTALLQLVEERPVPKTIIFCNKIETCRKVENALSRLDRKESQIRVLPFHSALAQEARLQNMKEFLNPQSIDGSQFLICTDRASRGIDFAGVDHVLLFDFPRDPSEYVRRVGRTARGAGGKGKAFVFVVGKQVSLARRIMERNQKGHPLHDVPSAAYDW